MKIKPKPMGAPYICNVKMAKTLLANNYIPLPAPKSEKGTRLSKWNQWKDKKPTEADILTWFKNHEGGVALLCGQLVAVDVDIDDEHLCNQVCKNIEEMLGKTIIRFGKAPRRAMFYRASDSNFKKQLFPLHDAQKVEMLANGCNCMAYGRHSETGLPYIWENGSPLDTPLDELPEITPELILSIQDYVASMRENPPEGLPKFEDGREQFLRDSVYGLACNAIEKVGLDKVNAQAIAKDAWATFKSLNDVTRPKGSNPNERYSYKDALKKAEYALGRFRKGSLEIPEEKRETNFSKYQDFFDAHLSDAKKDLISGNAFIPEGNGFMNVFNKLDYLASYADDEAELSISKLKFHLSRYISEMPSELLVEFPEWDGVDRVQQLASCLKVKNLAPEHVDELLKDWGAKMFCRVDDPKNQNRVLMLQGKQGKGKDSWLKELLEGLKHYHGELTMERDEKESLATVSDHIAMIIPEFERVTPKMLGFFKHMVTSNEATVRRPYARAASKHPMRCSFAATTNNKSILKDPTGNRRFIVFELEDIDWSYPKGESLMILAQFRWLAKSKYKASEEAEKALREYLEIHTPEDPEKLAVELFDTEMQRLYRQDGTRQIDYSQATYLLERIGKQTGMHSNTVSHVLQQNGRRKHTSSGRAYFCPDIPKKKPLVLVKSVKGMKGKNKQNSKIKGVKP